MVGEGQCGSVVRERIEEVRLATGCVEPPDERRLGQVCGAFRGRPERQLVVRAGIVTAAHLDEQPQQGGPVVDQGVDPTDVDHGVRHGVVPALTGQECRQECAQLTGEGGGVDGRVSTVTRAPGLDRAVDRSAQELPPSGSQVVRSRHGGQAWRDGSSSARTLHTDPTSGPRSSRLGHREGRGEGPRPGTARSREGGRGGGGVSTGRRTPGCRRRGGPPGARTVRARRATTHRGGRGRGEARAGTGAERAAGQRRTRGCLERDAVAVDADRRGGDAGGAGGPRRQERRERAGGREGRGGKKEGGGGGGGRKSGRWPSQSCCSTTATWPASAGASSACRCSSPCRAS